jgi:hypothetical protein
LLVGFTGYRHYYEISIYIQNATRLILVVTMVE